MVQLGRYQLIEELDRGGLGILYKAQDTILGRFVALKVLHPGLVMEPNFVNHFLQEARIAAALDHPSLVSVYDLGETQGKYYIAMTYMPGGSLKDLIKREGKLTPIRALEILEQVGAALSHAHSKGIIHRDLKPGNILLDENGKVRVADIGFAKVLNQANSLLMSMSGGLIGTPAYMAPEVWRNKAATPQTDIYSLGCILYEMLTGEVLFQGDSTAEVMTMHLIDGPCYAEDLPIGTCMVLDNALKIEPEERYSDVKDFLEDFKATLSAEVELVAPKPNKTILEHTMVVVGVAWSPDGKTLASASRDETIILWNAESGERLRTLKGHTSWLDSVAWSPDGKRLASGSHDHTIIVWDAVTGEIQRTLQGHTHNVTNVSWSPDGKRLASGSNDNTIIIWYPESGARLRTLEGHRESVTNVSWSPDGSMLASGGFDWSIILWDVKSGARLRTLSENVHSIVSCVAWSPDGKTLASGSDDVIAFNSIVLLDAQSGDILQVLEGHKDFISSVAWSPDGKRLASGSEDDTIIVWDADYGTRLQTLKGHTAGVESVAWSPDGKRLASGSSDCTVRLWDIA